MMIMEAFLFQMQISNQLHLKGKDILNKFVRILKDLKFFVVVPETDIKVPSKCHSLSIVLTLI